jgi:Rieske Fe-S protein
MTTPESSRRRVLTGLAAAGVAVPVVAACGSTSGSGSTGTTGSTGSSDTSGGSGNGQASGGGGGGGIPTSEIPVGGGRIFAGRQIVVTQPSAGDFKAFSAVCTHAGCLVNQVADGAIVCPCHGSTFSIKDGSVEGGFAQSPLPEMKVTVTGTTLTVT